MTTYIPATDPADCVFCQKEAVLENGRAKAFMDNHPMAPGHMLIVPKAHVATGFDAAPADQEAMSVLLNEAKTYLDARYQPRAYQIFSHVGVAAGQKVAHAHIHLVPVY